VRWRADAAITIGVGFPNHEYSNVSSHLLEGRQRKRPTKTGTP
jgi:hypothetical protein